MAIKVTLKNSVVENSVPTTTHLAAVGELALNANINSLGIYMRASDNSIVKMAGPGSVTTPAASVTAAGIAELATSAETTTGTDTARVTTPAGVKAVTDAERTTSNSTYLAKAGGTLTGVLAATAGSNSAASIHFGDTDSGLFGGTNTVSLTAGGTTRLTADTGVSVVGTLAVTGAITSTSDLTIADKIIHAGDTNTAIRFPAADTVSIETAGSETLRVDSGGRLLIGTSSAIGIGTNSLSHLQMAWTDKSASMGISRFSANTSPPSFNFAKARGGSVGTMTIVQENDDLGEINFCGADGADFGNVSARIRVAVDDTPATDDIPGRIEIYTFKASNNTLTEALRITNDGIVRVPDNGKFTAGASDDLQIFHDGSNSYLKNAGTGNIIFNSDDVQFKSDGGGNTGLTINTDGAVELYHNNSKKLETISAGVSISGELQVEDVEGTTLRLGNTAAAASDGDYLSGIDFHIKDNNDSTGAVCAAIRSHADQNHTATAKGTALTFHTTDDDTTTLDERMRILHNGNVGIGTDSPSWDLQVSGSNTTIDIEATGWAQLRLTGGSSENYITSDDNLSFYVGGSEKVFINTDGAVGIGTDDPRGSSTYQGLELSGTSGGVVTFSVNEVEKWNVYGADAVYGIYDRVNSRYNFKCHDDGNVELPTGNLKIGTAGKGIMFHPHDETATANGSDSNLLDDYEEGHFQPSISSSSRTGTITYSNRVGFYTKIGNRVFAQIYLRLNGGTNTTNTLLVTGLPFTCIGTASHEGGGYHTYMGSFFTASADRQNNPWVTLGTSSVRFYKISDGGSIKGNETSTSSTYLIFHVQYVVA